MRRALALALVPCLLAPGCAIRDKKERTARLLRAADRTARLGPTPATLASSISLHTVGGEPLPRSARRPLPLPAATVQLDLAAKRAVLVPSAAPVAQQAAAGGQAAPAPPGGVPAQTPGLQNAVNLVGASLTRLPAAVAFSKWDVFVKPATAPGAAASADDRTWLWLDAGELDPDRRTALVAPTPVLLLAPHLLVRLVRGALTGSVREEGAEPVGGVPTTRFRCNVDRDKAAKGLSDGDKQRLTVLFEADNIEDTFYDDVRVWVDDEDIVRRLEVTLEQRIDADTSFDLTYRLELGLAPLATPLAMPKAEDLAEVPTLPELLPGGVT